MNIITTACGCEKWLPLEQSAQEQINAFKESWPRSHMAGWIKEKEG